MANSVTYWRALCAYRLSLRCHIICRILLRNLFLVGTFHLFFHDSYVRFPISMVRLEESDSEVKARPFVHERKSKPARWRARRTGRQLAITKQTNELTSLSCLVAFGHSFSSAYAGKFIGTVEWHLCAASCSHSFIVTLATRARFVSYTFSYTFDNFHRRHNCEFAACIHSKRRPQSVVILVLSLIH